MEENGKKFARTVVNPAAMLEMEHASHRSYMMPIVLFALVVVVIAVVAQQLWAKRSKGA